MAERKIGVTDYKLFAEAWYFLAKARLMLVFRPFKKIVPALTNTGETKQGSLEELQLIKLSIARACVRSPWRTKCFEQALAAKMMLKRRGIESTTYFGVRKGGADEKMNAHAWLKSGDLIVTGWQKVNTYTILATF
jgi:hypothetical protein